MHAAYFMSTSLKVVSDAAVFCDSFRRSAIRWRIRFILTRRSPPTATVGAADLVGSAALGAGLGAGAAAGAGVGAAAGAAGAAAGSGAVAGGAAGVGAVAAALALATASVRPSRATRESHKYPHGCE